MKSSHFRMKNLKLFVLMQVYTESKENNPDFDVRYINDLKTDPSEIQGRYKNSKTIDSSGLIENYSCATPLILPSPGFLLLVKMSELSIQY